MHLKQCQQSPQNKETDMWVQNSFM